MSEQEIPIDGQAPKKPEDDEAEALASESGAKMSADVPDLSEKVSGGSQQDVLDFVLAQTPEQLIPWEPAVLPSLGQYYEGSVPGGRVEVKAMGLHAEKILATQRLVQTGYSLDYLFKHCVRFPTEFDPVDLLAGDRIFLLYYLRGITHGNNYEFVVQCSNEDCESSFTQNFDLNLLANTIKRPTSNDAEPFKVVLPYLSKLTGREFWVKIRFLRGRDAQAMLSRQKQMKRITGNEAELGNANARNKVRGNTLRNNQATLDQALEQNLNLIITEAMGEKRPDKIQALVNKFHARDTATIREFIRNNEPGIDTTISIVCPDCEQNMKIDLPITESFFRPTERRGTRS